MNDRGELAWAWAVIALGVVLFLYGLVLDAQDAIEAARRKKRIEEGRKLV